MRHKIAHRKFRRSTNQRKALLSGLALALVNEEKITTTLPKAKSIRPVVERLITKGRNPNKLMAFQSIYKFLKNKEASHKVVSVLSPRCAGRDGGYLRIVKAGYRYGDRAPMAVIEFVDAAP